MASLQGIRASVGRKKIEIKKIANVEALHVCFSKRRMGLFKKATDLSTLTGAEILIIVLSPAGKAFAFGSPGVEQLINCFLYSNGGGSEDQVIPRTVIPELNMKCMSLEEQIVAGKKLNQKLEEKLSMLAGENKLSAWAMNVDVDVESLGFTELEQLIKALENLKYRINAAISEISTERMAIAPPPPQLRMLTSFDPRADMAFSNYPQLGNMGFWA